MRLETITLVIKIFQVLRWCFSACMLLVQNSSLSLLMCVGLPQCKKSGKKRSVIYESVIHWDPEYFSIFFLLPSFLNSVPARDYSRINRTKSKGGTKLRRKSPICRVCIKMSLNPSQHILLRELVQQAARCLLGF